MRKTKENIEKEEQQNKQIRSDGDGDKRRKRVVIADLYFIREIGLTEHLSPTRSNGLLAMIKQMRMYALAFKTKLAEA